MSRCDLNLSGRWVPFFSRSVCNVYMVSKSLIRRFRCWAIPVLLCAVALLHVVRVYTCDQSAWGAGCGFGMFSKVDYHGSRFQRCYVDTDRGTYAVCLDAHFPELDFQSKVLPSERNLERLAYAVARTRWSYPPREIPSDDSGGQLTLTANGSRSSTDGFLLRPWESQLTDAATIYRVRVEQWRGAFRGQEKLVDSHCAKVSETVVFGGQ